MWTRAVLLNRPLLAPRAPCLASRALDCGPPEEESVCARSQRLAPLSMLARTGHSQRGGLASGRGRLRLPAALLPLLRVAVVRRWQECGHGERVLRQRRLREARAGAGGSAVAADKVLLLIGGVCGLQLVVRTAPVGLPVFLLPSAAVHGDSGVWQWRRCRRALERRARRDVIGLIVLCGHRNGHWGVERDA